MKNWLLVLLILGLTGCSYRLFSLGSAPLTQQWKNNEKTFQGRDFRICQDKMENAMTEREKYLYDKGLQRTAEEDIEWESLLYKVTKTKYDCAYELGYRFKPDLGWCWERSYNMDDCREYKKYRN